MQDNDCAYVLRKHLENVALPDADDWLFYPWEQTGVSSAEVYSSGV